METDARTASCGILSAGDVVGQGLDPRHDPDAGAANTLRSREAADERVQSSRRSAYTLELP
jgi:hypothetical protein